MVALGLVAALVLFGVAVLAPIFDPRWPGSLFLWLAAILLGPVVYQFLAAESVAGTRYKQGVLQFSIFDASRALQNDQLIAAKLVAIALASLIAWGCTWLALGTHVAISDEWTELPATLLQLAPRLRQLSTAGWLAGLMAALFVAVSGLLLFLSSSSLALTASLLMPKYPRTVGLGGFVAVGHIFIAVVGRERGWPDRRTIGVLRLRSSNCRHAGQHHRCLPLDGSRVTQLAALFGSGAAVAALCRLRRPGLPSGLLSQSPRWSRFR